MSVTDLKLEIIKKLTEMDDELVLGEVYRMLVAESEIEEIYKLTDDERDAINAGLKGVETGRLYSSEKAMQIVKEWLKK